MILFIENPNDSTKKLSLINKVGIVAGYKVNTQKSIAFLYSPIVNSQKDKLNKKKQKHPFTIATTTTKIKVLKNKFNQGGKKACIWKTTAFEKRGRYKQV